MIITRKWLENFVDLAGVKDEAITVALNSLGFEVDAYKSYKNLNDNLTLGFVTNTAPMEGTHLNFCFVDKGEDLVSPIVTGATNVAEGQYVVVADPGKAIATGVTLTTKELQGKTSEGMIVSLPEIGMSTSVLTEPEIKDWIYVVHTKQEAYTQIGNRDALEIIGFKDSTWEVDLTLNRSDALGAMQLVKELANYFEKKIDSLAATYEEKPSKNNVPVSLNKTKDSEKVIRSLALQQYDTKKIIAIEERKLNIFSNQDIWLKFNQAKTTQNFWLDLGNAIAIETGQPVLFLDPKKLTEQLVIKNNVSEKLATNYQLMHGQEVILTLGVDFNEDFLPTIDSEQILAVYLSLDPIEMRKQQKAFNTSSVFLQRWMKPISSKLYEIAAKHTVYWLDQYELYGASSPLEVQIASREKPVEITVQLDFINESLGTNFDFKTIKGLFKTLDFEVSENDGALVFKVDPYRTDISHQAHLVEEIARLYGYNNIQAVAPSIVATPKAKILGLNLKNQVENYLIGAGFNNVKTYSLLNTSEIEKWDLFNLQDPIKLMAPLSQNREAYRLTLVRSLVEAASLNYTRGNKNLKLYEFADVYNKAGVREKHLAVLVSGSVWEQKAYNLNIEPNFAYLKGVLDEIFKQYQIDSTSVSIINMTKTHDEIHPFINGQISVQGKVVGFIFKLNPRFEQANKIETTFVCELNLSAIEGLFNKQVKLTEISKFQKTSRDVTILLDAKTQYNEVINKITSGVDHLIATNLVDLYQDEALKAKNLQAVSIGFQFNAVDQQLTDQMVSAEWDKVLKHLAQLKIEVR